MRREDKRDVQSALRIALINAQSQQLLILSAKLKEEYRRYRRVIHAQFYSVYDQLQCMYAHT